MVGLCPLVARFRFFFQSDASFLIERLMLPAEAPRGYSFAVPLRIVVWQHMGDLRPLGGFTKEKWPVRAGTLSWYTRPLATRPQLVIAISPSVQKAYK